MITDKGQSIDIESQENVIEFIKGVLESVAYVLTAELQTCRFGLF